MIAGEGEGQGITTPWSSPHRSRRDVIGWGSIIHPPECLDPRCPVVEAVMDSRVTREPPRSTGVFYLYLEADGWVSAVKRQRRRTTS